MRPTLLLFLAGCTISADAFVERRYWLTCEMQYCLPSACAAEDVPTADDCDYDADLAVACVDAAQAYLDAGLCGDASEGMPDVCRKACGEL